MVVTHFQKGMAVVAVALMQLLVTLSAGSLKPVYQIDWLDVVGEGGVALFCLSWIALVLSSRPSGPVTNYSMAGLVLIFVSAWQDFLDEFVKLSPPMDWGSAVESVSMPMGIVVLTVGLYQWRNEQLVIRQQLLKRERLFRDHSLVDWVTQVGGANYLRRQLGIVMQSAANQQRPTSLLLLDLEGFSGFNKRFGARQGDRLLYELGELLILNLRQSDVLCRYAGDRYAVILPETGERNAAVLAGQLDRAVSNFAFHHGDGVEAYYPSIAVGVATMSRLDPSALEEQVNRSLEWNKRKKNHDIKLEPEPRGA